jgi:PAS domain S-box-containing protein
MTDFLARLLDTSDFPPRWLCGNWSNGHGWLHVGSDLAIFGAYVAIPCVLLFFLLHKRTLPFRSIFLLFGAFILLCGLTHLAEAAMFWWPAYRLMGVVKLLTAVVSWATVFALVRVTPGLLAMRTPADLEGEVTARTNAEESLRRANAELERRVAERTRELQESEERHRLLVELNPNALLIYDGGKVVFANPAAAQMLGRSGPEDLVGRSTLEFLAPAQHEVLAARWQKVLDTGEPAPPLEQAWVRADGGLVEVETTAHRFVWRGRPQLKVIARDVGERKRLEGELRRRAEELADDDRRKDEFLATLAHELRNPLAPIGNAVEVLRAGAGPEAQAEVVAMIGRQLRQMVRLVDDLLDVSRITRGKISLREERVDLAAVVRSALETSRPLTDAARQRVIVTLPPAPVSVTGDPTRLSQVVANLLNNATKYTAEGGRIELAVARENGAAVVRVRDEGIGIPAELLPRVFDLFVQADRSLERSRGWLGIGLTLVKSLVELHGGTVEAKSNGPGKGSEFTVRLPAAADVVPAAEPPAVAPPAAGAASKRVLVVDDNVDSAESLAMLLKVNGHEVRVAYDGPAALLEAAAFMPEVVLLDIGLPGMSGYEVARKLRELPEAKGALLVAQTGWGQAEDRRRSKEAGFDHHLVKPVDVPKLLELLGAPA